MTEYLDLVARLDTSDAQSDLQQLASSTGFDELEKTVGRLCDQMEGFSDTLQDLSKDIEDASENINRAAENMSKGGNQLNDVIGRISMAALGSLTKQAANSMARIDPENKTAWKAAGNVASAGLKAGATGAALGATIGSVIPGVGTVIGGAIGAGAGALIGGGLAAWDEWTGAKKEAQEIIDKQEEADAKAKQEADKRARSQSQQMEREQQKADQASFKRGLEGLNLNQLTAKSSEIDEQIREQEQKRADAIEQAQKFSPGSREYEQNLKAAQEASSNLDQLRKQQSDVKSAMSPLEREQRNKDREAKQAEREQARAEKEAAREKERAEKEAKREQERAEKEAAHQKEKEERDASRAALALQRENEKKAAEQAKQLDASADVLGASMVGGQNFGLSQLESMGAMIGGGGRQENVQNYLQRQIDYLRDIAGNTRGISTSTNDNYYG